MNRVLSFGGQVFALVSITASLGCSTNVQVGNDGGGGSGGSGSSTMSGPGGGQSSSSSSSANGGSGSGGSGGGASSSSGGAGSGGSCVGMITINGENNPPLGYACKGSYGAAYTTKANGHVGYETHNDPNPEQVWVDGCYGPNSPPQSGSISIQAPHDRRQLFLPVSDNYSCRLPPGRSSFCPLRSPSSTSSASAHLRV